MIRVDSRESGNILNEMEIRNYDHLKELVDFFTLTQSTTTLHNTSPIKEYFPSSNFQDSPPSEFLMWKYSTPNP